MAVPKGKVSKQRRNKRRSSVWKLAAPGLVACPKCGALHLPHRMCPECGTYNGREVKHLSLTHISVKNRAADRAANSSVRTSKNISVFVTFPIGSVVDSLLDFAYNER